jgi:hypothetical protein
MGRKIDGANILFALREEIANDLESLCQEFGATGRPGDTQTLHLLDKLIHLRELGLIDFKGDANRVNDVQGSVTITDRWTRIHKTLGGQNLADIVELGSGGMVINPIWGNPRKSQQASDLFVLMPFNEDLKPVYSTHMRKVAKELGLSIRRADDLFTAHSVMSDVWEGICGAHALIADCTGRNPNVFYEIGLAHVVGKPLVLITQKSEDVPFDLAQFRYIQYNYTPPGMRVFEQRLRETLKEALQPN